MARVNQLEIAQNQALAGDIDSATASFEASWSAGESRAEAALAEIAAFRGRWQDVVARATRLLANPSFGETLNVFADLAALAARAASETGEWARIAHAAEGARATLAGEPRLANRTHAAQRLAQYATRRDDVAASEPDPPADVARQSFENAVAELIRKKKKFSTPGERLDHLYAMAAAYRHREGAIGLFDAEGRKLPRLFNNAVFLATSLARANRPDDAWYAIRAALPVWWPVEVTQIAPVILLTEPSLAALMTPERCEEVLRQPRGPQASR